jgi:phage terminase small subunit
VKKKKKVFRVRLRKEYNGRPVYDPDAPFIPESPFIPQGLCEPDDPGTIGLDGMSLRQRLFVDAYVGPAAGCLAEAAWLAGYGNRKKKDTVKHGVAGHKVLKLPLIQEAIAQKLAKMKLTEEWTKLSLVEIASANLNNFFDMDEETGERLRLNFHKARSLGAMRQLSEYEEQRDGRIRIKVKDAMPALAILAKFFNLYRDNVEADRNLPLEDDPRNRTVEAPLGTVPANGNGHRH